jgi:hypothetical protein
MPDGGKFKIKEIKAFDTAEPIGKTHRSSPANF